MEIIEAESNMNDLITYYYNYQDATVEEYDEKEHNGVGVVFVGPANRSRSYPSIHGVTAVRATTGAVRLCPSVEVRAVVASHSHLACVALVARPLPQTWVPCSCLPPGNDRLCSSVDRRRRKK
jgi:NAD(P)H-hydrate repair Nnr-like enzyme with NAD(P)H-hydrate dehydratase domain